MLNKIVDKLVSYPPVIECCEGPGLILAFLSFSASQDNIYPLSSFNPLNAPGTELPRLHWQEMSFTQLSEDRPRFCPSLCLIWSLKFSSQLLP